MTRRWLLRIPTLAMLVLAMLVLGGCAFRAVTIEAALPQRIWVTAFPAACASTQPCYLVRSERGGPQRTLDGTIEGFRFTPHVEYELLVDRIARVRIDFTPQGPIATPVDDGAPHYIVREIVAEGTSAVDASSGQTEMDEAAPTAPPALTGVTWTLVAFETGDTPQPVESGLITLAFGMDTGQGFGALSGSGGCNQLAGIYRDNSEMFRVQAVATTRRTCETPAGIMQLEQDFLALLQRASEYDFRDGELHLLDEMGEPLLRFVPAEDS
jgi:heat shock protein HslJ